MKPELARLFLASILLSGCASRNIDKPSPTGTTTPSLTPTATSTETPIAITDPGNAAKSNGGLVSTPIPFSSYAEASDPESQGRRCVSLGRHTKENPQTVWGATRILSGGDSWSTYPPNGNVIYISSNKPESFKEAWVVLPKTVVCSNLLSPKS